MLGQDLLVAPITDPGVVMAKVYLPEGTWVHVFTGKAFAVAASGQRIEIAAPLGQPALFYRQGSAMSEPFLKSLKDQGLF